MGETSEEASFSSSRISELPTPSSGAIPSPAGPKIMVPVESLRMKAVLLELIRMSSRLVPVMKPGVPRWMFVHA